MNKKTKYFLSTLFFAFSFKLFAAPPAPLAPSAPKANAQAEITTPGALIKQLAEKVEAQAVQIAKQAKEIEALKAAKIKYGVIDLKQVVMSVEDGVKAQNTLKKEITRIEKILLKRQEELTQMQKDLMQKAPLMKESAKQQQQKLLEEKYLAFRQEEMKYKTEIQKQEQEAFQKISLKVSKLVELAAEEKGLSIVVDRNTSGTIYMQPPLEDLTSTIIEMYNKMTQKKAIAVKK